MLTHMSTIKTTLMFVILATACTGVSAEDGRVWPDAGPGTPRVKPVQIEPLMPSAAADVGPDRVHAVDNGVYLSSSLPAHAATQHNAPSRTDAIVRTEALLGGQFVPEGAAGEVEGTGTGWLVCRRLAESHGFRPPCSGTTPSLRWNLESACACWQTNHGIRS